MLLIEYFYNTICSNLSIYHYTQKLSWWEYCRCCVVLTLAFYLDDWSCRCENVNELFMKLLSSEILVWFVLVNKHSVSFCCFPLLNLVESMLWRSQPPPPSLGTLLGRASLSLLTRLWMGHGAAAAKRQLGASASSQQVRSGGKNLGCGNFVYQCEQPAFLLHLRMLSCQ